MISTIIPDLRQGKVANERTGMGAVMGFKNLKAVVVKKGKLTKAFDDEKIKKLAKSVKTRLVITAEDIKKDR